MLRGDVGLFFYVNGQFLIHSCPLKDAENYGDFLIYPESHFEIWDRHYEKKYRVDFDFFPRGRVVYLKNDNQYLIYYDRCIGDNISFLNDTYYDGSAVLDFDEHYQCHICNRNYVL